jgi:hypothetical protein
VTVWGSNINSCENFLRELLPQPWGSRYRRGHATRNSKTGPMEAVGEPEIVNGAATKRRIFAMAASQNGFSTDNLQSQENQYYIKT